jgi:PAS domain-containing protein
MAGDEIVDFELRLLCRDGSYRWTQWRAIASARAELVYASGRDVTERRRQDEESARSCPDRARPAAFRQPRP